MIKPTIGRIVDFWPQKAIDAPKAEHPNAAMIVYVWGDRMVNLVVFDHNGVPRAETSVTLLQDDDVPSGCGRFASWMPYQKGQAAKTESIAVEVERLGRHLLG